MNFILNEEWAYREEAIFRSVCVCEEICFLATTKKIVMIFVIEVSSGELAS